MQLEAARLSARPSAEPSARPSSVPPRRSVSRSRSAGVGIGALPALPALPEDDELALDVLGELYATAQQMAEVSDAKRQNVIQQDQRRQRGPRHRGNQPPSVHDAGVMT